MEQVIRLIVYLSGNEVAKPVALFQIMVIHTGEKPSQCILCDNEIAKPVALYNHMMIHT